MESEQIDEIRLEPVELKLPLPVTREELYRIVWTEPMLRIASRYGVSSSYMARICSALNVPRPQRGYWAKLAVNKAPSKPRLPDARPCDRLVWSRGPGYREFRPLPKPPFRKRKRFKRAMILRSNVHPLITEARSDFKAGRYSHEAGYLKPDKRLLVDLVVSETGLNKALRFANRFFNELESYGYSVTIAPTTESFSRAEVNESGSPPGLKTTWNNLWSPRRCTVVYIGTVAIGLTIIELSEEETVYSVNGEYVRERDYVRSGNVRFGRDRVWSTTKDFPTGRLCLQVYSPYPYTDWVKRWQETKNLDLNSQINSIVKTLRRSVNEIARLAEEELRKVQEEHKRWEEEHEKWVIKENERRAVENIKKSKSDLIQAINSWAEANNIERFFRNVEQDIKNRSHDEQITILEKLRIARELIGTVDALDYFIQWKAPEER